MNISVERSSWTEQKPDLVVLVGDPYADYIGEVPDLLAERLNEYNQGFSDSSLQREVQFSGQWEDSHYYDFIYYHTSSLKGFTPTESLKTVLVKALRLASETGRKKVAVLLRGADGEGLTEQIVEGALVGTYSFLEYKKDSTDRFKDLELVLVLPTPVTEKPAPLSEAVIAEPEVVAEEQDAPVESASEAIASESSKSDETESPADGDNAVDEEASEATPDESAEAETDSEADNGDEKAEESSDDQANSPADSPTMAIDPASLPQAIAAEEPAPEDPDPEQTTVVDEARLEELKAVDENAIRVGQAFAEGVNLARTLVARPASECTPEFLSKTCKKLASTHRFSYQSFGPKQLENHGYQGLVTVGRGSDNSPRMIEMTYTPEVESDVHLVLLGKGVTFDTGGISIKGADKMHLMIGDMAGAAAVIGAMETLGQLRPSIKVTALVVSAENKPDAKSYLPGDIIRYKNGTTVHVENTDAEGRLILADGLIRAGELGATHIVDLATLTGACVRALGPSFTGIMGANRKLVNAITRAGGNHGESYWRLPMPLEYKEMLKSVHADLNNVGGPNAGATTAALFLKEFVPAGTPWVHLDIAGTFWKEKPWKYYQEGPSGTGVKTVADLALRWQEHLG